jgi:hypothetical protein
MSTPSEFTRAMWASSVARAAWQPRIQEASDAWLAFELQSLAYGLRQHALVFGEARVRASGLPAVALGSDRFAVGRRAEMLARAYRRSDDATVGEVTVGDLLGYPRCCQAFFAATWAQGTHDTTWQMGGPADGPVEGNILGRWLGLRYVMHLPCSFQCLETQRLGAAARALLQQLHPAAAETIDTVLSWPIEWSALHGAAEIRYPVVKVVTRTGYSTEKRVVQRTGTTYPVEGARGLVFPYTEAELRSPRDNGFPTVAAQDAAHRMILDALRASPPKGLVLDLGAGNGLLLQRIADTCLRPILGVEVDARKAATHPRLRQGDLRDVAQLVTEPVDTIVVSQRRFEELPALSAWCATHARQVLVYSYDAPAFARIALETV